VYIPQGTFNYFHVIKLSILLKVISMMVLQNDNASARVYGVPFGNENAMV
jgi:hypothetical protein